MRGAKRRIDPGLIDQLRDEPYRFEFFQAVRLLLAHYREEDGEQNDLDLLGQVIRFRNSVSLSFPPSEIEALEFEAPAVAEASAIDADKGPRWRRLGKVTLTPSFFGLTGPMGVMPRHYTHYVAERELYHRDTATRAFLDIFSSRAVALFYQTWLKYRLHLQYEADRRNHFLPLVLSLAGFGLPGMGQRLAGGQQGIADESLAYYAGALRQRPQSAQGFSRVVADYFRVPCKVEQFVGQWLQLPRHELTTLGGANAALGVSTFCGERVWDRNTRVRLIVGPLRKAQFEEFLPGKSAAANLERFFQLMMGASHDCELRLILDKRDLVQATLGSPGSNTRLGWNGWLGKRQAATDSREVAYLIGAGSRQD
ncbi:type VI secretion system baseplate subunit TssG [Janthinobacterium sp. 17J80-10]|uniref:type VI secretion system baseplate subunit TssG n=1 Tax=Janthinobacterium sp. 17J80-10 TaxID=2497863 RepID=UPI0010055B37|nr:type VI secretion system baseplate subunit TssG [Janthinobacterium sp. 17J80-10]QAU34573.1 type VI secretion system baseplate subunit TssG [Janthinobacterium sp. 17J80-10]